MLMVIEPTLWIGELAFAARCSRQGLERRRRSERNRLPDLCGCQRWEGSQDLLRAQAFRQARENARKRHKRSPQYQLAPAMFGFRSKAPSNPGKFSPYHETQHSPGQPISKTRLHGRPLAGGTPRRPREASGMRWGRGISPSVATTLAARLWAQQGGRSPKRGRAASDRLSAPGRSPMPAAMSVRTSCRRGRCAPTDAVLCPSTAPECPKSGPSST